MKTKTIKLYSLDELPEDAQQTAHEKWLRNFDYTWGHDNRKTLEAFAEIFPVTIRNWSYGDQGSGVNFKMTCTDEQAELKGVRLATYIWNNYRMFLFPGKYFGHLMTAERVAHRRVKSEKIKQGPNEGKWLGSYKSAIILETSCVLTGGFPDDDILDPVYKFLSKPDERTTFEDLMHDCFQSWVRACEADLEASQSFERFKEDAEANEWTFTEEGEIEY